ncbi:MAG: extracellular solute-binding protein, partial [Firmicutes bacterium]|nr:extracellular solute-binding protein [Bacillota bacterium]
KSEGLLQRYVSPEAAAVVSPVTDTDGYFTAARLGTIGIAYNTNRVKVPPAVWTDLLKPEFKDGFGIANPAISGTAMVSVSMIAKNLGWDYIEKLRANGAKMGQGASQVVDDTAVGDLKACLAVDYIAINKIAEGAPLGFVYLDKIIVIPGPVAILKGTPNLEAAKLFVDFLLSREGQTIVAGSYTLPCRKDVPIVEGVGLIPPQEAVKRAMSLDYIKLRAEKVEIIDRFVSIMTRK